ncbi:heterodisulfide reductase-related iron-sulfur binding cluster [Phosphitispora sp. TUW77]|uniref:heterodisulfide reductase-related iron-sulfur binding cluster n=1 Tax=Phosphitispora sp. TUW77 TaxID=3152361 RepID=UPI003AB412AF
MIAGREFYWHISSPLSMIGDVKTLLYIVFAISALIFGAGFYRRVKLIRQGTSGPSVGNVPQRIYTTLAELLSHRRILRDKFPGIMHLLILWGFLVMTIGTAITAFQDDVLEKMGIEILVGNFYLLFSLAMDLAGLVVIIGVLMAMYRRYVKKPERLETTMDDNVSLILILVIVITGFLTEGLRIAGSHDPWAIFSPIGYLFSVFFMWLPEQQIASTVNFLWWFHLLLAMAFIAYIPYSKMMHLIASPINTFMCSTRAKGELSAADIDTPDALGAGPFNKMERKQLLDLFSCTQCGRCLEFCPAYISGQPLAPRKLILDLKSGILGQCTDNPVADAAGRDAIWSCTTCRACQEHCPVYIQHIDKVVEARRYILESEGASPSLSKALEGLTLLGSPEMMAPTERLAVMQRYELPVMEPGSNTDVALWIGCAGVSDQLAQDTTKALIKILKAAGINAAVLGTAEKCCGDPARRTGEEGLFQKLARENIEGMRKLGVKKVLTCCPHCYNTLKNEYPQFGADFEVIHHTEFISDLLKNNRIELTRPTDQILTYHDPCYLGRYNDTYDAPREILQQSTTAEYRELSRCRDKAVCCGGGGGQMYLESAAGTRINRVRFQEVEENSAEVIATACPFCKTMMDDAAKFNPDGPRVRVKDIAEVVSEAL